MDLGILAPVLGLVLAVAVVLVLRGVMRARAAKAARLQAEATTPSEEDYLDSSHIISRPAAGKRRERS